MEEKLKGRILIRYFKEKRINAVGEVAGSISIKIKTDMISPVIVLHNIVVTLFSLPLDHVGHKSFLIKLVISCLDKLKTQVVAPHHILRQFILLGVLNQDAHPIVEDVVVGDMGLFHIKEVET
mgnify:CR=1 FL=1